MDVEKLINCVRQHSILYDLSSKDYKNVTLKALIWESIASELKQNCNAVKQKWKTIRDGYYKNKKQVKGSTGSGRIVTNYVWSEQLRFLDDFNVNRKSSTNVRCSSDTTENLYNSQGTSTSRDIDAASLPSQPFTRNTSPSPPPADVSPTQAPDLTPTTHSFTISSPLPLFPPCQSSQLYRRKKNEDGETKDLDKILQYLNNKKKDNTTTKQDATDHLFRSYAESFKKLSPIVQAELKVNLAKLFAEAELKQLMNTTYSSTTDHNYSVMDMEYSNLDSSAPIMRLIQPSSQVHYVTSPSGSAISTDSITEPLCLTTTQQVIEIPDVDVEDEVILP